VRVFILGTGRCCTTTFSKACSYFPYYTSAHETNTLSTNIDYVYPDNHIESDPRLFWKLPQVIHKYPEALYVHLIREESSCIKSLSKRASLQYLAKFIDVAHIMSQQHLAQRFYIFVNEMIKAYLIYSGVTFITMQAPPTEEEWLFFLKEISCEEFFNISWSEWRIKYNKS